MGDKRISIRTLPSGEKVRHFPPDAAHPDGQMVLIRDHSPLKEKLAAKREHKKRQHALLHQEHTQRIERKQHRQRRKGLPYEKSPV